MTVCEQLSDRMPGVAGGDRWTTAESAHLANCEVLRPGGTGLPVQAAARSRRLLCPQPAQNPLRQVVGVHSADEFGAQPARGRDERPLGGAVSATGQMR